MRHIGTLPDEQTARRFGDFLLTQGIESNVEQNERDWSIWVFDEDAVPRAKEQLAAFVANPTAAHYQAASEAAADLREDTIRKAIAARKNVVNVRERWRRPASSSCPITMTLMFISMLVAFYTHLGRENDNLMERLRIAPNEERFVGQPQPRLKEIREGEWWRLVTPIFLHFGLMHIVFNMLMLYQLGMVVEFREGSFKFLLLVLAMAVVSNLAQYYFVHPLFGGMSGVVYGLFGYVWMRGKFDPHSNYVLAQNSVLIMMGWYFACLFHVFGDGVANWAHSGGLLVGMVSGIIEGTLRRR